MTSAVTVSIRCFTVVHYFNRIFIAKVVVPLSKKRMDLDPSFHAGILKELFRSFLNL